MTLKRKTHVNKRNILPHVMLDCVVFVGKTKCLLCYVSPLRELVRRLAPVLAVGRLAMESASTT